MSIRTVIADDEPLARERLQALLSTDPEFSVVQHCRNGREVVDTLRAQDVDLLLLDVQMPGLNGFDAIRASEGRKLPMIVFITAYDRFAVDAFQVSAVDYLLKPVERARFHAAMEKVKRLVRTEYSTRIIIPSGAKDIVVNTGEITWIEAADYYACLHVSGKTYLLRESIKSLEARLDPAKFVRIHRSTIVNIDFVREIHREGGAEGWVLLSNGERSRMSAAGWRKLLAVVGRASACPG